MVLDLVAGTDVAACVVFDPAAVAHLRAEAWDDFHDAGPRREAAAGNLALIETGSDGQYKLQAFVNEPAPPSLLKRAWHAQKSRLLRVPGGTLCSSGLEHLPLKDGRASRSSMTTAAVPAGDYRADAYFIQPVASDDREHLIDRITGWAIMASCVLVFAALLLLGTNDWHLQPESTAIVIALAASWGPMIAWHSSASIKAWRAQQAAEASPSVVLVLARLSAGEARSNEGVALALAPAAKAG